MYRLIGNISENAFSLGHFLWTDSNGNQELKREKSIAMISN